jgi:hypothetical protein
LEPGGRFVVVVVKARAFTSTGRARRVSRDADARDTSGIVVAMRRGVSPASLLKSGERRAKVGFG